MTTFKRGEVVIYCENLSDELWREPTGAELCVKIGKIERGIYHCATHRRVSSGGGEYR